ncbi:mannosyl-glycoprotein endo-beta-N-acetylglucosaminidase [Turicibacter sp. HGF1]|uniref:N-acetylglucosaminidase n=1 Tax=Turicibacter sp. HGF1 TaxID=910310 RepID=UPI0001FD9658|nr:glucosaminidase domain-containing protein [Turicibacter sp. HGF1]EGC93478.1 mannosyl-glycoprotein endo-beta-N-acetylglucosaminidase [Turicibacter sp. HGF1]
MNRKRGKKEVLKGTLAIGLLINQFSSFGAIVNATVYESEVENNSDIVQESIDSSQDDLPDLDGNLSNESTENEEIQNPGDGLPEEIPNDEEFGETEDVELEIPKVEEDLDSADGSEESKSPEEQIEEELLEETASINLEDDGLFSIESRSSGSGLVQLWQVVPDGQQSKEGKTTSEIMKAVQCKPNHNLYPSGGQSEHNTYVNSCYVDDALYLGEDTNYYYIYLSGYEGKVPKSESHWFELDLNNDGTKVKYEIQTVAYYIPGGTTMYSLQEKTEPLDVPELNYYDQYLDKYNDINERGITTFSTSTVQSPSYYANENGTLVHYLTSNVTKANSYSKVIVGKAPSWMSSNVKYYSYDGIYFYTNWRNIKVNGQGAVNQSNPFYNYYQYLPVRSKSNYSANIFDNYTNSNGGAGGKLVNTGQYFYAVQDKYGINGALQYAMGIHESGWGKSSLSLNKNNLFGMNATDNNPYGNGTSFPSVEAGINYHADRYLSWGYTDPVDDWRYMGSHVGNKGSGMNVRYASDPFWGEKIAGWYYRFDSASGLKDYDYYTIGIKQSNAVVDVKSQANSSSSTLYQTKNKKSNIKIGHYPVLITGNLNGFYQIKTDTPLNSSGNVQYNATYQWPNTYGYINNNNVIVVNGNNSYNDPLNLQLYNPTTKDTLDSIYWSNGKLNLEGWAIIEGLNIPTDTSVSKKLIFTDKNGKSYEYNLTNVKATKVTNSSWANPGNLYNYDYAGYKISIDESDLPVNLGEYKLSLEITIGTVKKIINLSKNDNLPETHTNYNQYDFNNLNNQLKLIISSLKTKDTLDRVYWDNDQLVLEGWAIIEGRNMPDNNSVVKTLILMGSNGMKYEYPMTNVEIKGVTEAEWVNPNKIYNYDYSGYSVRINKDDLPNITQDYSISVKITSGDSSATISLSMKSGLPNIEIGNFTYNILNVNNKLILSIKDLTTKNTLDRVYWENNQLVLEGWALIDGHSMSSNNSVTKILILTDSNGKKYEYPMTNVEIKGVTESSWANPGNRYNYDYSGYKVVIPIDDLPTQEDSYLVSLNMSINNLNKIINIDPSSTSIPDVYTGKSSLVSFEKVSNKLNLSVQERSLGTNNCVDKIEWNNNQLTLEGWGLIEGLDMSTSSVVSKILVLESDSGKKYEYPMTNIEIKGVTDSSWANPGKHYNYDYSGYKVSISQDQLPKEVGSYTLKLKLKVGNTTKELILNPSVKLPAQYTGATELYSIESVNQKLILNVQKRSLGTNNCVDKIEWNNNQLTLEGWGLIEGLDMSTSSVVSKILVLESDSGKNYEYPMTNVEIKGVTDSSWANPGKHYNYDYSGYKVSISQDQLPKEVGSYTLKLKLKVGNTTKELILNPMKSYPNVPNYNGNKYELLTKGSSIIVKVSK